MNMAWEVGGGETASVPAAAAASVSSLLFFIEGWLFESML
jgi:hypothetical protein